MNHGFPVALDEAVGGLTTGRSSDDVGFVAGEMGFNRFSKEFLVAVSAKKFGKPTGLGAKEVKGRHNVLGRERGQCENPIVAGGTTNKYENIPGTPHSNSIAKANVDVHFIEVAVECAVDRFASGSFVDGGLSAKRHW